MEPPITKTPSASPWVVAMLAAVVIVVATDAVSASPREESADPPPPGVEQILPRGGIPAVFDPSFVPADEAEIPDDAWVLGVSTNGVAKAYSLNLLNRHEVVNDWFGAHPVAAVW